MLVQRGPQAARAATAAAPHAPAEVRVPAVLGTAHGREGGDRTHGRRGLAGRRGTPRPGRQRTLAPSVLALLNQARQLAVADEVGQDGCVPQHTVVEGLLRLDGFLLATVAYQRLAVLEVHVERLHGTVLHAQCLQCATIDL